MECETEGFGGCLKVIPFHRPLILNAEEMEVIFHGIHGCLQTGIITNSVHVKLLEDKIAKMYNVNHCIATSSCTQGLLGCLMYLMNKDPLYFEQVITPSFTWKSIKWLLRIFLVEPVYQDIDVKTWLPLFNGVDDEYSIGLHTFGNIMTEKATIYDGSHALGCRLKHVGEATVFSLAATKLITSCEGGLVITNNEELAEFVRDYRDVACRMSEAHAIIGLQMLKHLEEIMKWKSEVWHWVRKHIPGQFQEIPNNSNYNVLAFINTENLIIPEEIETRQYYKPLKKGLPNTDYIYENIICLPSYYDCNIKKIVDLIKEANDL